MLIPSLALPLLETSINSYLQLDPFTIARLRELDTKVVSIEFTDWNAQLYFIIQTDKIKLFNAHTGNVDTHIRGTTFNLLRTKFSASANTIPQGIEITGDIQLGQTLQSILRNIDIDWEEHLSHWAGDVVAHQLGNFARAAKRWTRSVHTSMQTNITNYLQQEALYLPTRHEVEHFCHAVDTLRNDVERLVATLKLSGSL